MAAEYRLLGAAVSLHRIASIVTSLEEPGGRVYRPGYCQAPTEEYEMLHLDAVELPVVIGLLSMMTGLIGLIATNVRRSR